MTSYARGLIEGFLLAHNAPRQVMESLELLASSTSVKMNAAMTGSGFNPKEIIAVMTETAEPGDIRKNAPPGDRAERIRQMVAEGLSAKEIAAALNLGTQSLMNWCSQHDVRLRRRPGKESRIPESEIENVRRMVEEGKTDLEIGQHYGYGNQTVYDFRLRHGIKRQRGNPRWGAKGLAEPKAEDTLPPVATYTDDEGNTVTKYPPGFARGIPAGPMTGKFSAAPKGR